jgi:ABC-type sugar transport system ATPase subunit
LAVSLDDIVVDYPGTRALDGVSLDVRPGEVHGLAGENGAGKSTLVGVLAGVVRPTAGQIRIDDRPVRFQRPKDALAAGVAYVAQEVSLIPYLSAADNVMLGREPGRYGLIDRHGVLAQARALARRHFPDTPIALERRVDALGYAEHKVVEILRALAADARVIVLDEPTASLPEREKTQLFHLIARLGERGVAVVYISHFLRELLQVAHRVSVLRDGRRVVTAPVADLDEGTIVQHMLARGQGGSAPHTQIRPDRAASDQRAVRLQVSAWCGPGFGPVDFSLGAGEVVALLGLTQAGHVAFAESLYGAVGHDAGELRLDGEPIRLSGPRDALAHGIALVPDSRMTKALVPDWTVVENLSLVHLPRTAGGRLPLIRPGRERRAARAVIDALRIKTTGPDQAITALSGGNKQKVSIGRWQFGSRVVDAYRVAIFVEPTEGVDVGVKAEIQRAIADIAEAGLSVLLISSDLREAAALADRAVVFAGGGPVAEIPRARFSEDTFVRAMAGEAA